MPPAGRFLVAFDNPSLTWSPTWTAVDATPNLVTSYSIDRGRQFELDRTDTGRAIVEIADQDGILDPTNPTGPYYGKLEPLLQAMIGRRNPITGAWHTRYRGFIEEFDYGFHPSQRVNMLTVALVDIFEILAAIEMQPGEFGDPPPADSAGQVFFDTISETRDRMAQALGPFGAGLPVDFYVLFSGNVALYETVYSPGESVLAVIQEAADAEFPGVGNVYTDRLGRLCFHGRLAKFYPDVIAGGALPGNWDYRTWLAGDGAAVNAAPTTTAHIREFAFNRGLSKVINSASATPKEIRDADVAGQLVTDATSIGLRGIRSWSAQNLLTMRGNLDGTTALVETKRFAQYYVQNYAVPNNRITAITFRSMHPTWTGAAANWALLSQLDIADSVNVTVASPGGGGFTAAAFFVEGVHEEGRMLTPDMDDVTMRLDLSPRTYYTHNPFPSA